MHIADMHIQRAARFVWTINSSVVIIHGSEEKAAFLVSCLQIKVFSQNGVTCHNIHHNNWGVCVYEVYIHGCVCMGCVCVGVYA